MLDQSPLRSLPDLDSAVGHWSGPTASSPPLPDPKGARPALRACVHLLWLTPSTHKAQYSHMYKYLTKTV